MPKPKQSSTKPGEYGKHRICSQCQAKESEILQVITIILPPTIPKRTDLCRNCLSTLIDDSIEKNRAKQRDAK